MPFTIFTFIALHLLFNVVEFFSFINLFLIFLFIIITLFFIFLKSTLLYYSNLNINHCLIEFITTLFSVVFLCLIISPALIILLDFDLIIIPSFIIYSLGLQWAWQFNISFLPSILGFSSYCDHYIISSLNKLIAVMDSGFSNERILSLSLVIDCWLYMVYNKVISSVRLPYYQLDINSMLIKSRYLFEISQYLLLPIYSFIRLFVYSFDVIHTLGFYSWAIKIDAIPGRINLANTLRLVWKGEYRGRCFELCGQGHLSMIIGSLVVY